MTRLLKDKDGKYICEKCNKKAKVIYLDREKKSWICEKCHFNKRGGEELSD
jgi:ribosomal protein L37AE/L43A